ncbi:hypothetical protein RGQ29_025717 [Quercus rubra]|uniref:Uncharacterized protein n=1 Tax=Quercus rubra TaxID=3512 RepID=A0AAN7EYV3_QUERU|nr:hypothetical protein RGQ29_025717 [Quercus rubra]
MVMKPGPNSTVRSWRKTSVLRQPITLGHVDFLLNPSPNIQNSRHSPQTKTEKPLSSKLCFLFLCFLHAEPPPPPQPDRRSRTKKENQPRQKLTPSPLLPLLPSCRTSTTATQIANPLNSTARLNPKSEPERVRQKFLVSSASSLFHPLLPLAQISTTPHTEAYHRTSHWIRC